jgi:hypothetical protein
VPTHWSNSAGLLVDSANRTTTTARCHSTFGKVVRAIRENNYALVLRQRKICRSAIDSQAVAADCQRAAPVVLNEDSPHRAGGRRGQRECVRACAESDERVRVGAYEEIISALGAKAAEARRNSKSCILA